MRKTSVIILSVCLLTIALSVVPAEKNSSSGTPFADAGEDQVVHEGDVVQFNGSASTGSGVVNVLHVSVWQYNDLQLIIDYTGSEDKFSVTQIGLSEFNAGTPSNLSSYDAIVFGISNSFEWKLEPIGRTSELKGYVSTGGGIVWTHDTIEYTWDYGADLEEPAGVDFDPKNCNQLIGLNIPNVEIIMDHEILHNLFDIGNTGDIIPKTPQPPPWFNYAHTSRGNVTTAEVIIQHSTTSGSENFYLTTHEFGEGRVVVDEIGHAYIGEYGDFWGLPSLKECQILVNAVYWVADGGNISGLHTYSWDFDANLDSDGDGNPTNDIDATGPTPTNVYGDDGIYTVTLTVTDDKGLLDTDICNITVLNVDPTTTIESATMDVEIGLKVAGRKYNEVGITLYEDGNPMGYVSVERLPGNPNVQMVWIPVTFDLTKAYTATVTYIPEDPPNIGSNPVWLYIKFGNGSMEKIHHTFNVQQSKKRNSDHWNHVEPWEVDLNAHVIGHELSLEVTATDPGSDDLTFQWNSEIVITYYNNGISPDPYPSPDGIFPFKVEDFIFVPYKGAGSYTLTITDDDNGVTYKTIDLA